MRSILFEGKFILTDFILKLIEFLGTILQTSLHNMLMESYLFSFVIKNSLQVIFNNPQQIFVFFKTQFKFKSSNLF